MPALFIRSRDGTCRTVDLADRPLTLGRAMSCDVVLRDDGGVSREHASVFVDERGCVTVTDRGSKNGTRVDGGEPFRHATRVARRSIRIGDYDIDILGLPDTTGATTSVRFVPDEPSRVADTHFFPSSKKLDLSHQRLGLLMSLTERIGGAFERKQLLEQAIDACREALGFERALIALKTHRGEPELPVTRNISQDETGAYKVSRTLINQALVHGERAVVNNPATDLVENFSESLVRFPICSALCVPILHRDEILGVVYGDRVTQASTYTPEDVDFLAAIAQQVGVGLANLRLFQEHLRSQKMYLELEQARAIQERLLPAAPLAVGRVAIAGYNAPSSAVGGDYYDFFDLGEARIGLTIADVTGHGLPASLMMANLQAAVRVILTAEVPLTEVARRLNALTCRNTDTDVFITAIIGRLDAATGTLEYIAAGHPGPIVLRGDTVEALEPEGALPFGVEPHDTYELQRLELGNRDQTVLFYTDGLIEADNPAGEMFELTGLLAALRALPDRSPDVVLEGALHAVQTHAGQPPRMLDDVTLLAIQYRPA